MKPCFSEEQEEFRGEVRGFLAQHSGVQGFFGDDLVDRARVARLYRAMGERGWLSLAWPLSAGGLGLPPAYEFILWDEMAYARAARPPLGSGIVAKTIVAHGTDEQRQRFLPGLRRGEISFSLGYSEPEAGSDLAAVRTKAVRDGASYVVTGEKRWTSLAHCSDYLWLLCRTGRLESRSRGLTILIVDLDSPGIIISPIPTIDGGQLNEVRLNDVVVPAANRVGEEDDAWKLIVDSLAIERHVQFPPARLRRDLEDITAWAVETDLVADPMVASRLADLRVEVAEVEALALVLLDTVQKGRSAVVEAACNKLAGTVLCQGLARAALDFGAPEALVQGTTAEFLWRQSILETIGGGTSEVMRGVVARARLGLAASR